MEFEVEMDCPFCGENNSAHVEFNEDEFDRHGGNALGTKHVCDFCSKPFWFDASLRFDVEVDTVLKKEPTHGG